MKGGWWKTIAGLAVLAVVAVGLGLLLHGQQPTPEVAQTIELATATDTAAPTTTPEPTATGVATQAVEATATPTPTPLPPTGTPGPRHLSAAVEVPVPQGFRLMDLRGDTVVGSLRINGEQQLVTLDLTTGEMRQVSSAPGTTVKYFARISESWVVWIEEFESANGRPENRLKAYNREIEREYTLEASAPRELDLSDEVVVWTQWEGQENQDDIHAQNLTTGQRWSVTGRPGRQMYPHISGSWLIYLDLAANISEKWSVALRAYNLESGEDRVVGQVFHPLMGSAGTYHAISGSRVVWTTPPSADSPTFRVLSLDLEDPQAQPAVVMSGDFGPGSLRLFDEILVYHRGWGRTLYDLQRKGQLAVLEQANIVLISGNRVVWEESLPAQEGSEEWSYRLYTARIEQ